MQTFIYNPNEAEKKLIASNPADAQRSIELAYLVGSITALLYFDIPHNTSGDAFRHCLWNSFIAQETSPEWAKIWTDAHEYNGQTESLSKKMDLYNNDQGIQIIKHNSQLKKFELIKICSELVRDGKLLQIKNGKLTNTTSDGFNIPNIFRVIYEKIDDLVEFLKNFHSNKIHEIDGSSGNALHRCIYDNYYIGFEKLVTVIDVNQGDGADWSPLFLAARYSYGIRYAEALIANGANPNYQDKFDGDTPLMMAAGQNNLKMISFLIPISDKKLKSRYGLTAYDIALAAEHFEAAAMLI